ncbi:Crp/Fnr family transcriptional regulator [Brucella pseudogrignonensis]|uniref:Crp/Fnr family transcriptional regulator n=1 Tax=Brucella pseudogrignonensis TaxID=419475 RepID=UPI003D9688A0
MTCSIDAEYLSELFLFRGVNAKVTADIIRESTRKSINRNEIIFNQGSEKKYFFVLIFGRLKIMRVAPDGQQVITNIVDPGEVFGFTFSKRDYYSGTSSAVIDSIVLQWPTDVISSFFILNPKIAYNAMKMMERQLQTAHERIQEISTQGVEQRVARTVLRLIEVATSIESHCLEINFPVSRQDIAELAGTTLHTVSRILSKWRACGWIESGRQSLKVLDINSIRMIAKIRN